MSGIATVLRGEWMRLRVQILLGLIFVLAAWPKLLSPPVFAKNVHAYSILPDSLISLFALALPGIEIAVGLALVLGWRPRAAALVVGALTVVFMIAIAWNLLRENPVNCSCFELDPRPKSCAELFADMRWLLLRDLGVLLMAAHVFWAGGGRSRPSTP